MSKASAACSSPSSIRRRISRMSLSPQSPTSPLRLFSRTSISSVDMPATRFRWKTTAGSMSPEATHHEPPKGVSPIEVSTHRPPATAEADAPLPRCSTMTFTSSGALPSSSAVFRETYACEVPWKP
ncbi:hypothetical protein SMICM304S_01775 [Streptomyces microflavus]